MNRKLDILRSVGLLALMGGGLIYALTGCGGTSSTVNTVNPTDTAIAFGQHLFVANHVTNSGQPADAVLRFDNILSQTTGTAINSAAQFELFTTITGISDDFSGRLLAPDFGQQKVFAFNTAQIATGITQQAGFQFTATAPQSVVFDSTNDKFYVVSAGTIQRFNGATGLLESTLTDNAMSSPVALAIDDEHQASDGSTGSTLMVVGTNGAGLGVAAIYPDILAATNVANSSPPGTSVHITQIDGVNLVNPQACAYSDGTEHMWFSDPLASGSGVTGRVFRIDNVPNLVNSAQLGGSVQIASTCLAVDTSQLAFGEVILTMNNLAASPDNTVVSEFAGSTLTNSTSDTAIQPFAVLTLNGVTNPVSMADDSTH